MADVEDGEETCALASHSGSSGSKSGGDKMFSLKKWNAVAMWSWDVECDTCAICRVQVMDEGIGVRNWSEAMNLINASEMGFDCRSGSAALAFPSVSLASHQPCLDDYQ
ncbi:RNF7 isoform 5 [Pongo abelii]|uniref:RNF7 isoform 5 n=1 Tax=Pongo abelii TaxID=9601 RepID=A0A2J8TTC4_PONAB|nr:RNF7 isoform 5 [Pongo abelii]